MSFVFIKGAGKFDRLEVVRPGGHVERLECPKQGIIPHDMVHFAVEHTLQARGFLRRVKDGEAVRFTMAPDAVSDAVERLVEVFQGDAWSGGQSPPAEIIEMYLVTCHARGCQSLPVDEADILAVRQAVVQLTEQWARTPVGASLALTL